jgi:predicted Zn-dependent peptidase
MAVRTRSTRVLERTGVRRDPGAAGSRTTGRPPADRDGAVTLSVTDGGLRIVTESVPGVRSVSVGIWVGVGSVDEVSSLAGASHYLEHLLFKGTRHRSGHQIAAVMDAVGGEFNAFTAHEYTCYHTHVLSEQAELAIDVVSDVVLDARVTSADVEIERSVILEEIAMRDDDPEDTLADAFAATLFRGHPAADPVIGSVASISGMARTQIAGYYRRRYAPERMVVSVAGDVDHRDVVRWVKQAFGDRLTGGGAPSAPRSAIGVAQPQRRIQLVAKDTEQAHLMVGTLALPRGDRRRHAMAVLTTALGGGMSSRLFRTIREEHGLAYSCYATSSSYADVGSFAVYAGCHPANLDQVATLIRAELAALSVFGLTDDEVQRAKGQLTGSLVLSLEDTESRMSRIGRNLLVRRHFTSVDDELLALDSVSRSDVDALARELLAAPMSAAVVGPYRRRSDLPAGVGTLIAGPPSSSRKPVAPSAAPARNGRGRVAARAVRPAESAGR